MSKILNDVAVRDGAIVNYSSQLEVQCCHSCGGTYALAIRFLQKCREEGPDKSWTCPYCKAGTVFRVSDIDKVQKKLDKQKKQTAYQREEKDRYLSQRDAIRRSASALKGVVTKNKKQLTRVQKGVCPCCNRHFKNLQRHMESQHSDKETVG